MSLLIDAILFCILCILGIALFIAILLGAYFGQMLFIEWKCDREMRKEEKKGDL